MFRSRERMAKTPPGCLSPRRRSDLPDEANAFAVTVRLGHLCGAASLHVIRLHGGLAGAAGRRFHDTLGLGLLSPLDRRSRAFDHALFDVPVDLVASQTEAGADRRRQGLSDRPARAVRLTRQTARARQNTPPHTAASGKTTLSEPIGCELPSPRMPALILHPRPALATRSAGNNRASLPARERRLCS